MSVAKATRGTILTVLFRIISFVCTQWTVRMLDPKALGQTNVQLDLLFTSILFWRTGVRYSLTNGGGGASSKNTSYLTIPLSAVLAVTALAWHWRTSSNETEDYRVAGIWYCAAACLEGWTEPAVLHSLMDMNVALKASAEGLAGVCKALVTVMAFQRFNPVTAVGVAQFVYAIVYSLVLYSSTLKNLSRPRLEADRKTLHLTAIFTGQALFQYLLTQADKLVLAIASEQSDLGVYAMASVYGSLAARFILQPLEENARLYWSRNVTKEGSNMHKLYFSYTLMVKLVLYVGLVFGCLAVNYTWVVLNVLAGRKWGGNVQAVNVLSAFCVYTGFLAWNGMTEAFVYATASSGKALRRLSIVHAVIMGLLTVVAHYAVTTYGPTGLVAANAMAMALRGFYSLHIATTHFQQTSTYFATWKAIVKDSLPNIYVLATFGLSYVVTSGSLKRMMAAIEQSEAIPLTVVARHVGVGSACGVGIIALAYMAESDVFFKVSKLRELEKKSDESATNKKDD